MRYQLGNMALLVKVRKALDVLAGLPRQAIPSPPAEEAFWEDEENGTVAFGWAAHLIEPPLGEVPGTGGLALLKMPSDVDQYLGQSADVDGESVELPDASDLFERDELPPACRAWLDAREGVGTPVGG